MGEGKIDELVRKVQERYGHLITKEAALSVLRNDTFQARILRVFQPYEFEKKGRKGKVCRVELQRLDSNEKPILVLWDDYVDRLLRGELKEGDVISISGFYLKEGEVHLGRGGKLELFSQGSKNPSKQRIGVIRALELKGKGIEAVVEFNGTSEKLFVKGKKAHSLLGLKQAHEGISLAAIFKLKKPYLIGTAVKL
ncbi:hypothetical protein DRN67_04250 [Candidatus Micrarchaeota archaeon]|nr:MAG: hypothetical protein DRN67_04250 [Candidatus Micrarchaeota archaeon]